MKRRSETTSTSHSAWAAPSWMASTMPDTPAPTRPGASGRAPARVERARLGEQAAALRHDVRAARAAADRTHVGGGLLVDAAERHVRDGLGGGEDRRAAGLGADPGVRGLAVELGGEAEVGRRRGDHLADRRRVVEHVAEVGLQLRGVELLGALEGVLLAGGEQQLEPDRGALDAAAPRQLEDDRDRGLVVGAEDAVVGVLPAAVDDHRVDRDAAVVDRVEVGAQEDRAPAAAGDAREQVAGGVLLRPDPHLAQLRLHALGALSLMPERARDAAERGERVVEPRALGVGGRPQEPGWNRPAVISPVASAASAGSGTRPPACSKAAPTKSRNSGAGRSGRDLNSGWNCEATKNGWSEISMISTRRSSGDVPGFTRPSDSCRRRRKLFTS